MTEIIKYIELFFIIVMLYLFYKFINKKISIIKNINIKNFEEINMNIKKIESLISEIKDKQEIENNNSYFINENQKIMMNHFNNKNNDSLIELQDLKNKIDEQKRLEIEIHKTLHIINRKFHKR